MRSEIPLVYEPGMVHEALSQFLVILTAGVWQGRKGSAQDRWATPG